jgi:hypothetical protein
MEYSLIAAEVEESIGEWRRINEKKKTVETNVSEALNDPQLLEICCLSALQDQERIRV